MTSKLKAHARSLADHLEAAAARFPNRTAVVEPDGTEVTYSELDRAAERVAAYLAANGVVPGDRVALLLPKSATGVIAIFGILKARAAYVPIDWTAPAARVRTLLEDCGVQALFADASLVPALEGCACLPACVILTGPTAAKTAPASLPGAISWKDALDHNLAPISRAGRSREDLAYILYTSGSTGVPKGVMLSHGNALSFVNWCSSEFHPTEEDRFSSHAPFHFDLSILDLYVSLKHGAEVHLIDDETGKNPKQLAAFIAGRQLTIWYSTPSILQLLVSFGALSRLDFSRLRLVLFAGEVFPAKHLRELTKLWPRPRYYNLYGPTETNVCTYAAVPSQTPDNRTDPYPIGWPCTHCSAAVLDAEGEPVPTGKEGVLYIAGESVFQGYWHRPSENGMAFRFRGGVRWYCTGDVVREDALEGFIYLGRRDRMVKRRGYRIELDDIERALYRHQVIREAAVIAAEVDGSPLKIAACLVAGTGLRPGVLEMKMFCARQLPGYMSPDVFIFLDALPRTSTDKTDYRALAAMLRESSQVAPATI